MVFVNDDGQAQCPHEDCGAVNNFREIDMCIRHNPGELTVENGRVVAADWTQPNWEFGHVGYDCAACKRPVGLPDGINEVYS